MLGFVQPSEVKIREAGIETTPILLLIKKLLLCNLHVFCMGTHERERERERERDAVVKY
jgi:hypothetical protein